MFFSIAIDGPAASGKTSVSKYLSKKLNFSYVSSGMLYRIVALYIYKNRMDYNDDNNWNNKLLKKIKIDFIEDRYYLNGFDVTIELNSSEISKIASIIAVRPIVRNYINEIIREISNNKNVIVDGRDIGSVVLKDANAKIFLDADVKTRAERRMKQNVYSKNEDINRIIKEIIERDNRDYTREISPLIKCDDALILNNSEMNLEETVAAIEKFYMGNVTKAHFNEKV